MRSRNRFAAVVLAFAQLLVQSPPGHAEGGGTVVFEGDVTLATFPCPGGPGCVANFNADVAMGTTVTTGPGVGVVTGVSATVNYSEVCTAGEALTGSARGTATLTGTNVTGTVLPLTVPFQWTRVGTVAVITGGVVGAALFLPTGGVPVCTGGSLSATVVGAGMICFFTPSGVVCVWT